MGKILAKNKPLFIFLTGLVVTFGIVFWLWKALFPFFIGFLIAYLLMPAVNWIDGRLPLKKLGLKGRRAVITITTIIVFFTVAVAVIYLLVSSLGQSISSFLSTIPSFINNGLNMVSDWIKFLIKNLSESQQVQIANALNNIGSMFISWFQGIFSTGVSVIFSTFTFILSFFILPFFIIFFMTDVYQLKEKSTSLFPESILYHIKNFFKIMDGVFGRYFRAQILVGIIMGILVTVSLMIIGVQLAPALGFIAAVFQLIPAVGGAIAAAIGMIVTLAVAPDKIIWVVIMYAIVNLVIGTILLAKFSSRSVNMNTSVVMILIVVGGFLAGVLGMIVIVPIVAVIYGLYKYTLAEIQKSEVSKPEVTTEK
jgi:predicted PurR-regulated permease PerM